MDMVSVEVIARFKDENGNRKRPGDKMLVQLSRARELEARGEARILGAGPTETKREAGKVRAPTGGAAPSPSSQPAPASPPPTASTSGRVPGLSPEDQAALKQLEDARRLAAAPAVPTFAKAPAPTPKKHGGSSRSKTRTR